VNESPSLAQLADVVPPPPVPWMPQTIGWQVLGVLLALLLLWLAWRGLRRYWRNRYRREALAELHGLEAQWKQDAAKASVPVLVALPVLIKRCALAAWPRDEVASMNGAAWAQFVLAHAGHATHGAQALAPLLREIQYHDAQALQRVSAQDVRVLLEAAHQWIQGHVSA
jgi:hypothetical protein